jgi:hypothetical protein
MKSKLLLIAYLCCILGLFAQNRLDLHFKDSSVEKIDLSTIDSLFVSESDTMLNIRLLNKALSTHTLSSIDSITFNDTLTGLPFLQTITADKVSQSSARSGFTLTSTGTSSVTEKGICWSTSPNPTIADGKSSSTSTSSTVYIYMVQLTGGTTYYVRSFATNASGTSYGNTVSFTTLPYSLPVLETTSVTNDGGCIGKCVGNIINSGGYAKNLARGFCWSRTNSSPTLDDSVSTDPAVLLGSYTMNIQFPAANVTYYVCAYATNATGTAYGSVMTVKPTMGTLTYTLDPSTIPAGTTNYTLLKVALDSAMYYYNRYGTFSGNIWVYYNAGIPTAQASYRGSIGFGPTTSYMHVSTSMHEIAHWLGSGTTSKWQSLCVGGVFQGTAAAAMLKSLTGETLKCDNNSSPIHFWPYGLNYRSEVTSANEKYVYEYHVKIVNAMKTDCGW